MKLRFLSVAAAALMFAACNEPLNEAAEVEVFQNGDATEEETIVPNYEPIVLGDKLPNPYSMDNMRKAIEVYNKSGLSKSALSTDIKPTHYYMRFKPKNEAEVDKVEADTTVFYYSWPLDREIVSGSTNYRDPELPDSIPSYMYCTVPVNHILPNVDYEILEELYILEDVNVYDDPNETEEMSLSKHAKTSYWQELKNIALENVGMEPEIVSLSKSWRPSGKVTYYDNSLNKTIPLQGAPVHTVRTFIGHQCCTDANGEFSMPKVNCKHTFFIKWKRDDFKIRRKTGLEAAELVIASKVKKTTINFHIAVESGIEWKIASVFRGTLNYYYNSTGFMKPDYEVKIRVRDSYDSDWYKYDPHYTKFGNGEACESVGYVYANSISSSADLFFVGNAIPAQGLHESASLSFNRYNSLVGRAVPYADTDNDLKKDWGVSVGSYLTRKQYSNYSLKGVIATTYMTGSVDPKKMVTALVASQSINEFHQKYKNL